MEKRIPLAYPEWPVIKPACHEAEWRWLSFLKALSASGEPEINREQEMHAVSIDIDRYFSIIAIQKQGVGNERHGLPTYLCLTGETAGYIAADADYYAKNVENIYLAQLPEDTQAFILRPLLKKPMDPSEFRIDWKPEQYRVKTLLDNGESWYVDAIVESIYSAGLPLDEGMFRENIEIGFEEILSSGRYKDSGSLCVFETNL